MVKNRLLTWLISVTLVAALTGGVLLVGSVANAKPPTGSVGTLTITPATGSDTTGMSAHTSAACPPTATAVNMQIIGPVEAAPADQTFPPDNPYLIVTTTHAVGAFSTTDPFDLTLRKILRDAAAERNKTLKAGEYDLTARCVDSLSGQTLFGTFTGAVYFSSPTAYTTTDPNGGGGPTATTTTLVVTPASPAAGGTMETLTATVSPAAAGSVQFMDRGSSIGAPVTVSGGTASTTTTLPSGTRSLTAVFTSTDQAFGGSTSAAVSYVVNGGQGTGTPTTTALVVTPTSPAAAGTMETLKATISPAAPGNVQFKDGNITNIGEPVTVSGDTASTTATLSSGDHSLTAEFTPTDNTAFNGSTSAAVPLTVTGAAGGGDQSLSAIIAKVVDQLQRAVQVQPILRLFLQPIIHFLQFLSQFTQTGLQFHPGRR
ncbi:MAG TPA: Ig-like domain-containing protein [Mycobacterium sp.]|nr:Ig-like domain-containing protein [Mycobacterium sp.]